MPRTGAGRGPRPRRELGIGGTHLGAGYADDEREALVALDRYKRKHRRPFPHLCEILDVLKSLGWRKAGQDTGPGATPL